MKSAIDRIEARRKQAYHDARTLLADCDVSLDAFRPLLHTLERLLDSAFLTRGQQKTVRKFLAQLEAKYDSIIDDAIATEEADLIEFCEETYRKFPQYTR